MDGPAGGPLLPDVVARLLDCVSDVVARFDAEFRHLYVNAAVTRVTGIEPSHFIGRSHRELGIDPAACDLWESRLGACFEGQEIDFQLAVASRGGHLVHEVHLLPETDATGAVRSVLAVGRDATTAAIARERERLAAIVQHVADGLVVADPSGRLVDMNPAALRLHGFAAVEDARMPLAQYERLFTMRTMDGRVLPSGEYPLARTLAGQAFAGVELEVRRQDPPHRWIGRFSGAPVVGSDGRVTLAIVTLQDVTDEKTLASHLREREERYRFVTEAMDGLVYDWDLRTGTVHRSAGISALLGYEPSEIPPDRAWWLRQVHPDDLPTVVASFEDTVGRRGAGMKRDYRVRHRHGHWVWVWDHSRILYDDRRQPVRVLGCTVSIDARKRAEERLLEADRLKDQFLMMLGHELRQPLHAMQAAAGLVRLRAESSGMERAVAVIERQVAHLTRLVDDLGDVSRVKRGKLRLTPDVVDMREAVDAAVETIRPRTEADGQALRWIPPASPVFVQGDRARLQQVVLNLLTNAHGHTPPGGTIAVTLSGDETRVELCVADTGAGIEPTLLPHVFDIFVQGSDREPSGMGIGLALVKGLVELHGGTVRAASAGTGRGSAFTVTLPAGRSRHATAL